MRFLKKWGIPAMTLQLVACPEWKHVMMVGLKKTLPKKQSKILSSDAICIVFTNNWQFLGNIAPHIFVVQCSVGRASFACVNDWHAADKARGADITTPNQCMVMTCKNTLFTLFELWSQNVPLWLLKNPSGLFQKEINQVLIFRVVCKN